MSDLCIACNKVVGKHQHGVTCDVCDRKKKKTEKRKKKKKEKKEKKRPVNGYSIILVNGLKQYIMHTSPSGQYLLMARYWLVTKGKVSINLSINLTFRLT